MAKCKALTGLPVKGLSATEIIYFPHLHDGL